MLSSRPHSSFSSKRPVAISNLEGFRRTLTSKTISGVAVTLITDARRQCSVSNHQSAWRIWSYWRSEQKINPFANTLRNILAHVYEIKYKHSSIDPSRPNLGGV